MKYILTDGHEEFEMREMNETELAEANAKAKIATDGVLYWSERPDKTRHTFKLETIQQVNDCREYWKSEVADWDKTRLTVTVEAGETEIRQYEAHTDEIHGWSE